MQGRQGAPALLREDGQKRQSTGASEVVDVHVNRAMLVSEPRGGFRVQLSLCHVIQRSAKRPAREHLLIGRVGDARKRAQHLNRDPRLTRQRFEVRGVRVRGHRGQRS
jgi:hypothetical protein